MFYQSQAFPTKKNPDFVWLFLFSKKASTLKKSTISKFGFKKAELATQFHVQHSKQSMVTFYAQASYTFSTSQTDQK